jgi:H+/Cl- antiporter ClcA
MRRLFDRLRDTAYLKKWLILGALIGVVAGLGAIVFSAALEGATKLLLGGIGGYTPPTPAGEGNALGSGGFTRPWAIPLVVGLGGLISGYLVFRFAPEAEGHGTDAAIAAVHHNPRGMRPRAILVKLIASAATIGSGGSAGREGPTAQISAGFGSLLARRLDLSPEDARIAVAVGTGAGIGAIFRAPLGGAVLGTEILYRDDLEPEALMPSLVASIVGFSIFGAVRGFTPIFGTLRAPQFDHPIQLLYYALLGVTAGLIGRLYARSFYGTVRLTHRLPGSRMIKPAIAGLIVGGLGLMIPAALGTGYGFLQEGMRTGLPDKALWFLMAIPLAKIAATSLSIGSGGSGGIFGPGMVIGGSLGLVVWRSLGSAPGMPTTPAPFMVVGMIACFGAIAHAPLALMLMVAEMTGSLALLPPAMIALGLSALLVGEHSIYESQLRSRAESPYHRMRFGLPLLASVRTRDAMSEPRLVLDPAESSRRAATSVSERSLRGAPVVDPSNRLIGVVEATKLDASADDDERRVADAIDREYPSVRADAALDVALDSLVSTNRSWLPVVDEDRRLVGILAMTDVIRGYRGALGRNLRLLSAVPRGTVLVQEKICDGSELDGRTVADAPWPGGAVAISVERGSQLIFPEPGTHLAAGDILSIVAPRGDITGSCGCTA